MEKFIGQILNDFDLRVEDNVDPLGYVDKNGADDTTTITIRNLTDLSLATIYDQPNDQLPPSANPFNTDDTGNFQFYAANGRYVIVVNEGLSGERVFSDILLFDALVFEQQTNTSIGSNTSNISDIQNEVDTLEQTLNDLDTDALNRLTPEIDNLLEFAEEAPETARTIKDIQIARIGDNILTSAADRKTFINEAENLRQVTVIEGISTRLGEAESSITQIDTSLSSLTQSFAERTVVVDARFGTNEATVATLTQTVADGDQALAQDITALTTRVGQNEATIVTQATAISDNNSAIATLGTTLQTQGSSITTLQTSLSEETNTRASQIQSINSEIDGIDASITSINATVAENDSFARSAISSLQTRTTNAENDISAAQLTLSSHTTDLGNLFARAYLGTNINGRVTGIDINNDGSFGSIIFEADVFGIRNPNSGDLQLTFADNNLQFGGTVNIGNGAFTVDLLGTVHANSISATGLTGDSITFRHSTASNQTVATFENQSSGTALTAIAGTGNAINCLGSFQLRYSNNNLIDLETVLTDYENRISALESG